MNQRYEPIGVNEDQYASCKAYTREYAKSFYFASHVLPKEKRMAAYSVYAFCRYADNLVDSIAPGTTNAEALLDIERLRREVTYLYDQSDRLDPQFHALQETVHRYGIPKEYFLDLLKGVEMDLTKKRYDTFEELYEYCYFVASVVGLIMTKIFGSDRDEALAYAADLGIAMQLTNILRDVREDYRMGRIYLPKEELVRFGISEGDLSSGKMHDKFRAFMQFQIDRARMYYARASKGIPLLTSDGSRFCVRLMSGTYAGILAAIERMEYDVFAHRAYVPLLGKVTVAMRTVLPFGKNVEELWKEIPTEALFPQGHKLS